MLQEQKSRSFMLRRFVLHGPCLTLVRWLRVFLTLPFARVSRSLSSMGKSRPIGRRLRSVVPRPRPIKSRSGLQIRDRHPSGKRWPMEFAL